MKLTMLLRSSSHAIASGKTNLGLTSFHRWNSGSVGIELAGEKAVITNAMATHDKFSDLGLLEVVLFLIFFERFVTWKLVEYNRSARIESYKRRIS